MRGKAAVSLRTVLEAAIALLFFGSIAVVVRYVSANAITIGIARLAITVSLLLSYLLLTKRLRRLTVPDVRSLATMGMFFALHWLTFFFSIKIGSASIATIGLSTYGVHLVVLGWFFNHNRVVVADLLVLVLAIAGNVLVVPEFNLRNQEVIGLGLGVLSGFFYAFLPILHQRHAHIPGLIRAMGQFFFGLVVFLCFSPLSRWDLLYQDWLGLLFLGIMCTLVAHTLWVRVTTTLSTTTTSVIYYLYVLYEVDPLRCPGCGGEIPLRGISFIDKFQPEVVEKILRHCGLWKTAVSRPPPVKSTVAEPEPCYDQGYFDRVCI